MPSWFDKLQARAMRGETRDEDIELPMPKGGKRDPKLPPDGRETARKALEGYRKMNEVVEGIRKRAK